MNGKEEGYWYDYQDANNYSSGNYKNGVKEGRWEYVNSGVRSVIVYTGGLKSGADTTWINDTLHSIIHYKDGRASGACTYYYRNGMPKECWFYAGGSATYKAFYKSGAVQVTGKTIANPDYVRMAERYSRRNAIEVPQELQLDMVERNICGVPYFYGGSYVDVDADSVEHYMRSEQYRIDTAGRGPLGKYPPPELRSGTWTFYYENGNKKEEGEYLPKVEGEWLVGDPIYFKTGWWKIYNEKGKFVREELYENGKLVRTKEKR
jgi:antitoxin component YwqK of YwqJK toxin-antitoxin module